MPCYQSTNLPPGFTTTGRTSYTTEAECLQACREGACCEGTTCTVKPQCQCQGTGKVFKGVGTVCSPNPCEGPCCINGVCSIKTQADCAAAGGTMKSGIQCECTTCGDRAVAVMVTFEGWTRCDATSAQLTIDPWFATAMPSFGSGYTHSFSQTVSSSQAGKFVGLNLTTTATMMSFSVGAFAHSATYGPFLQCTGPTFGTYSLWPSATSAPKPAETRSCDGTTANNKWDWIVGKTYESSVVIPARQFHEGSTEYAKLTINGVQYL